MLAGPGRAEGGASPSPERREAVVVCALPGGCDIALGRGGGGPQEIQPALQGKGGRAGPRDGQADHAGGQRPGNLAQCPAQLDRAGQAAQADRTAGRRRPGKAGRIALNDVPAARTPGAIGDDDNATIRGASAGEPGSTVAEPSRPAVVLAGTSIPARVERSCVRPFVAAMAHEPPGPTFDPRDTCHAQRDRLHSVDVGSGRRTLLPLLYGPLPRAGGHRRHEPCLDAACLAYPGIARTERLPRGRSETNALFLADRPRSPRGVRA